MGQDEPESISLEEFRRLYGKQKKIRVPRRTRPRAKPLVCTACGKRIAQNQSTYFQVDGRSALPYHLWCRLGEPDEGQQD